MAPHTTAPKSGHKRQQLPTFDELLALAQSDPEALTRLRQQMSQDAIAQVPVERRSQLDALQSHIERKLSLAKNPLHASVLLSQEMQRSLSKLQQALNNPAAYLAQQQEHSAQVIRFPAAGSAAATRKTEAEPDPRD